MVTVMPGTAPGVTFLYAAWWQLTSQEENAERDPCSRKVIEDHDGEIGFAWGGIVRWEPWESNDPWRMGMKGSRSRAMQICVYSSGSQTLSTQNLSLLASDWILQTPFRFITQWVSSFMSLGECCSAFVLVLGLRSLTLRPSPVLPS